MLPVRSFCSVVPALNRSPPEKLTPRADAKSPSAPILKVPGARSDRCRFPARSGLHPSSSGYSDQRDRSTNDLRAPSWHLESLQKNQSSASREASLCRQQVSNMRHLLIGPDLTSRLPYLLRSWRDLALRISHRRIRGSSISRKRIGVAVRCCDRGDIGLEDIEDRMGGSIRKHSDSLARAELPQLGDLVTSPRLTRRVLEASRSTTGNSPRRQRLSFPRRW